MTKQHGMSWVCKRVPLLASIICLLVSCGDNEIKEYSDVVKALVDQVQNVECQKSDGLLILEHLSNQEIIRVHEICQMSSEKKLDFFSSVMSSSQHSAIGENVGTLRQGVSFYNCGALEVPQKWSVLLNCEWHDAPANPVECSMEGKVACLWGCNNSDPVLGWHTKFFNSRTDMENEIRPKGYIYLSSVEGGDYSRQLDYGYRFQVHSQNIDSNGKGMWHNEGPEPSPSFSWFAFVRGWWPNNVRTWHSKC